MSVTEETIPIPTDLELAAGVEYRIFDTQLCEWIDFDWLVGAVESAGITAAEVSSLIADGLVRKWKSPKGKEGFLLYSEREVRLTKGLRDSGRYPLAELRHFVDELHVQIEISQADILTYDSHDISDYEHFRRRSLQEAEFFKQQIARQEERVAVLDHQIETEQEQLKFWTKWHGVVSSRNDEELHHQTRLNWRRALAHVRFVDEFTRIHSIEQPAKLLELGYSPEVFFSCTSTSGDGISFSNLDWRWTLERFKETINEGNDFPLRTPDFTITRDGITFATVPTAASLAALEEKYQLEALRQQLLELGAAFWVCDLAASGRAECAECRTPFERTKASRKYCSEGCRNRAKQRRYRENNPAEVDAARARYYQ